MPNFVVFPSNRSSRKQSPDPQSKPICVCGSLFEGLPQNDVCPLGFPFENTRKKGNPQTENILGPAFLCTLCSPVCFQKEGVKGLNSPQSKPSQGLNPIRGSPAWPAGAELPPSLAEQLRHTEPEVLGSAVGVRWVPSRAARVKRGKRGERGSPLKQFPSFQKRVQPSNRKQTKLHAFCARKENSRFHHPTQTVQCITSALPPAYQRTGATTLVWVSPYGETQRERKKERKRKK